jgi:hypothetical protein
MCWVRQRPRSISRFPRRHCPSVLKCRPSPFQLTHREHR